jgi:uncharacterized protein (UPF0332 family)
MSTASEAYLAKSRESLAGAASEFINGRYNNVANRCYYACFQAAIAALNRAEVYPPSGKSEWGHAFVQAQFVGLLIHRRRLYPSELRDTLSLTLILRQHGDYEIADVSQKQASRALTRARIFVTAVAVQQGSEP